MTGAPPDELPPPERSADEIREAAEEVLRRAEFRDDRSIYERVVDWLSEMLSDVLGALTGGGRGAIVAWALFLLGAVAIAYLVWRIVRDGAARTRRTTGAGHQVSVRHAGRSAEEWRTEADAHAAAGRWRDAVRCRWRAMVAELVERRAIDEVPGTTSGEYRRLVAAALPDAAAPFGAGTDVFDRAWYGGDDVGAADHDSVADAAEQTVRLATVPARSASPAGSASSGAGEQA